MKKFIKKHFLNKFMESSRMITKGRKSEWI